MLVYCSDNCKITDEQKKSLEKSIKNLEIKGINLSEKEQEKLKKINKKLSNLYNKF